MEAKQAWNLAENRAQIWQDTIFKKIEGRKKKVYGQGDKPKTNSSVGRSNAGRQKIF